MRHALAATSLVFVASTSFAAGMYDQPYAVVERGDNSEVRKEAQVAITKVDGKGTRDPRRTDPIIDVVLSEFLLVLDMTRPRRLPCRQSN